MSTPHPKRSQDCEDTDLTFSSPNAVKRTRDSLDWTDGCETAHKTTREGNCDQFPDFTDFQTKEIDVVGSDPFNFSSSALENPVPGSDIALAEFPLSSSQPVTRQGDAGTKVCYGALCEVQAALLPSNGPVRGEMFVKGNGNFQSFIVVYHDSYHGLFSPDFGVFARLDNVTSVALQSLYISPTSQVIAIVESATLRRTIIAGKLKGIFSLSLNIFGPEDEGDIIGERLAKASVFLQHPYFLEDGYEYYNPQYFYPDNKRTYLTYLIGLSESDMLKKRLSDEIEGVLASLDDTSHLSSDAPDDVDLNGIVTPLKRFQPMFSDHSGAGLIISNRHQRAALNFIRQHEDHYQCQSIAGDLRRLIGLLAKDRVPSHAMGGILGDMMGLGKTLSILSAIVSSRPTSISYQKITENSTLEGTIPPTILRSRATLVVVSSIQVLDGWKKEIAAHLQDDILSFMVFHGEGRPKLPENIVEHDLVLTTYATLVADCKASRVLHRVAWFRVVLDEAHWIRNQSSQQFRAVERLLAQRRWCLTGTPIQNRLEDLLSLLKFLHFEPFCRTSIFQQYILNPLSTGNFERAKMLHVLLRGICLRRNEKYLELPEPCYKEIKLIFSPEEKSLYNEVLERFRVDLDNLVSNQSKTKKYVVLFAMVMKLRRLCNHGTMLTLDQQSSIATQDLDSESFCDYCQGRQDDNLATLNKDQFCPECCRIISPYFQTPVKLATAMLESSASNSQMPAKSITDQMRRRNLLNLALVERKISTKLRAVVENLKIEAQDSKSLVFSYWTSTLDLLQGLLVENNISSLRIDGRVSYEDRIRALETFSTDPQVTVLLMSIQTGSVGLNLATANRVHIIEPQWNPSVEEQAIARALRMGQTRTVTVVRYVMKTTVEENIQNMQKKKKTLAKFSLDGADSDAGTLQDLKFILDLRE